MVKSNIIITFLYLFCMYLSLLYSFLYSGHDFSICSVFTVSCLFIGSIIRACPFDPLGRPTITVGRDHYFTCVALPSVRLFVLTASVRSSTLFKIFTTGEIVSLAGGIIDDTYVVLILSSLSFEKNLTTVVTSRSMKM